MNKRVVILGNFILVLVMSFSLITPKVRGQEELLSVPTDQHEATIAVEWMTLAYETVRNEKLGPTHGSRVYGYLGVALYEAVVPGMPDNFSVGGQLPGLPILPYPDETLAWDWPSVANGSLSTVLTGLFPEPTDETTLPNIETLRQKWVDSRAEALDMEIVERSVAFGDEMGGILLDWIATDNYGPTRKMEYEIPTGEDWYWEITTEGAGPHEPFWSQIRPLGLEYPEVCNQRFRIEYSSDPNSTFYKQAQEVMLVGDQLTDQQRETARFWVDTPVLTGTPGGHWVMIENQLVEQMGLKLNRAAEMYMLVNAAMMDAFISTWSTKYQVNLLRPVTYIQRYLRRNWSPYIESPPFPEYPSGHSVVSGAAAEVLTTMFGAYGFTDRTPIINGHENLQRSFTSFEAAAYEAAISRLYGGIHYRAAIEDGIRQGRCVSQQVITRIRLRSLPQGE
ncbi:MAG: vanadium-dependent haloperoxidase [Anaerolineae bacterium]|nr:vanadium-dependent haloperoxidase [Anaerolineae bacterium]